VKVKNLAVVAIIPARYAATRLPGKPLLPLAGKPIIQHVYERTCQADYVQQVLVATDDIRIATVVEAFGGQVVLTAATHETGTDRIAEVAQQLTADVIVNVQGDEPFIDPARIDAAVEPLLTDLTLPMATLAEPLTASPDLFNPNIVKVVINEQGNALYFSRAPIPLPRQYVDMQQSLQLTAVADLPPETLAQLYRHIGLYVYRREFLLAFSRWPRSPLEAMESLEQLRVLARGETIRVVTVPTDPNAGGIDTPADLARAQRWLATFPPS
jgi:3-deoxy-manno-octulosonate cytidylyltransferase (CMP-KDO synthetase)